MKISENCGNNCNCGDTCVGGLTCHCGGQQSTTFICPNGNCSIPNNNNNNNCGCGCNIPEECLPDEHRVPRLIAPSRDTHTNWNDKDPVILEGVLGFTKDRLFNGSLEYFIGDGIHKYSELVKYAAAPASTSNDSNTLVLRDANGKIDVDSLTLPDATPTQKGVVKASTTTAADNAVKSDADGSLSGWKDAIINAIIASDGSGGLATDENGKMMVDFDQMPTDKFEALLKSLKMLIPLEADLNTYVNGTTGDDTIEDGRGTPEKPFKTIQAAVDFVTQTYAINTHNVVIYVAAGRYEERVYLPQYSRTTGKIYLRSLSGQRDVTIVCPQDIVTGTVGFGLAVYGGPWYVRYIEIERTEHATTETTAPIVGCVYVGQGGILYLSGYGIKQQMPTGVTSLTTETYRVYNFRLNNGGTLYLEPSSVIPEISMEKPASGYPEVRGFAINKKSWLQFNRSTSVNNPTIKCYGSCDAFISINEQSQVTSDGAGSRDNLENNNVVGKRFAVSGSSFINIGANSTTFPGDTDGTVDNGENGRPQTFCWYA